MNKRKIVASSIITLCILVVVGTGVYAFLPSQKPVHAAGLPYNATANGPYSVKGNQIVGADGKQYIFHGIGRDGLEYNCSGEGPLDQQHLAYMGPGTSAGGNYYWGANTVRLPLSEGFWLNGAPGYPCTAQQYQALVKQTVDNLTALKLNVILDLQWVDAGGQSGQGGGPWALPDGDSVTFWQQVAPMFKGYSNVLFEAYNEPHVPFNWTCWQNGCQLTDTVYSDDTKQNKTLTYQAVGMQTLVNTIRGTGANNLVVVGGMNWGYDLSQIDTYPITGTNVVYDTHPYPYTDKMSPTWDNSFGNASAKHPVISAENGEYDCGSSFLQQLYNYFDAHGIGYVAWAWVSGTGNTCGYPQLINDYQGTPSTNTGQFVYQKFHNYAVSSGPIASTWYFAEGRVGAGFREFITVENPDPRNTCVVDLQYLLENGSPVTKQLTVPAASRATREVGPDLGTSVSGPGISVATVVTNDSSSACNGFVAERPMYFNYHGDASGSDVVGATHTATTFYFADIPTGGGYNSFITILNPPGGQTAQVTAKYYAGGKQVGTQSISVNGGTRGTISPNGIGLPQHVSAVVTSSQPVVTERPAYFNNINGNFAGTVTGGSSVIGSQALAGQWYMAEGYAGQNSSGGKTQENLVISNLDPANAAANVTINLEYINGTTRPFTITVQPMSQTIWDVNAANAGAPSNEVSAYVTSSGANVVVERQMYFNYAHTINGVTLQASGGTEVTAQTATYSVYNFAEGYSNSGYNEWLTLQNPTANAETIYVTMVNGLGTVKTQAIPVGAHTRSTFDVTAFVRNNMAVSGNVHSYEVSMTVQTLDGSQFVAERPMYFNTAGSSLPTHGGTDAFGYAGT